MGRHTGRLRQSLAPTVRLTWVKSLTCAKSLIWVISHGFPVASHLALSGSEPVLGDLSVLSCVRAPLLAKMDSSKEAYG